MTVPPIAWRPLIVAALAKLALQLPFAGRYGWQRDELYYAVAGRHLQGGYVEFPAVTGLLSAFAHLLFGWSLVGFRLFPILAGVGSLLVAALVARELGGERRTQLVAAVIVGFSPLLVATNGLFQPVSFDQLATLVVLWLALRLLLGRGSWPLLGLAIGVGLETKYTLAVPLVLLLAGVVAWRRDVLSVRGLAVAAGAALLVFVPNLVWEARHDWVSVHWFLSPPGSATDETRPMYVANLLLLTHLVALPIAGAGILRLVRDRMLRPLGWTVVGTVVAYLVLGGKSYYASPVVLFALAAGAGPFVDWAAHGRRRFTVVATAYVALLVALLPVGLPVLPLDTASDLGILDARSDYQDEVGWHRLARDVERRAQGADVVLASNYGEAGALDLFGRQLPPVGSAHVTFRYWRPHVTGRRAVLVGFAPGDAASLCTTTQVVGRIRMPVDNEERGRAIVRCTLAAPLASLWPALVARTAS